MTSDDSPIDNPQHARSKTFEEIVKDFEQRWQSDRPPEISNIAAMVSIGDARERAELLTELVAIDIEKRWLRNATSKLVSIDANQPPDATTSFTQPHLLGTYQSSLPALVLTADLVGEEYRARWRWGDRPSHQLMLATYAHVADVAEELARIDSELNNREPDETLDLTRQPLSTDVSAAVSPPQHDAVLPSQISRYRIKSVLGQGGFAKVYLANDPRLQRDVAVKVLTVKSAAGNDYDVARCLNEARMAAQLNHPAIVDVYDVGQDGDEPFLVMEYVEGETVQTRLRDEGRMSPEHAVQLVAEAAEAIYEAHAIGLVHRDLKPANIIIDKKGQPHITDFGLAIRESELQRPSAFTGGTPPYMSPEQIRGAANRVDSRTDIWSLGVVLYELLTGSRPFQGKTHKNVFEQVLLVTPVPPRDINEAIGTDLERICLRCLQKDVEKRYEDAEQFANDLRRWQQAYGWGSDHISAIEGSELHSPPTNLPARTDRFIGRSDELVQLSNVFGREDVSVVTLTGTGGIGKTRLALQLAEELASEFQGGCWWVDLTAASDQSDVVRAVLNAFGVPMQEEAADLRVVVNLLEYRQPLLIVFDNFEQVLGHAQQTIGFWREHVPSHIRFLVTSRSPLGLAGEQQFELTPLPFPQNDVANMEQLQAFPSAELFLERAKEMGVRTDWDEENLAAVADICAHLDGIPLAVELAAARLRVLQPSQMLSRLGQKFTLLKSNRRDLAPRQRTLQQALEWSFDMLDAGEKLAFLQVSRLPSGFFLDAAESVVDLSAVPDQPDVIDVIQGLREKCLLTSADTAYGVRFSMYRVLRDFGTERGQTDFSLAERQEQTARIAAYLIDYAETWNSRLHSSSGLEALDRISLEIENLFTLQQWALDADDPDMAARAILAVVEALQTRGSTEHWIDRLERSLEGTSSQYHARLQTALSIAWQSAGEGDRAFTLAQSAVEIAGAFENGNEYARALLQQAKVFRQLGQVDDGLVCTRKAESLFRDQADLVGTAACLIERGFVYWRTGHAQDALDCYDVADNLASQAEDQASQAIIARNRGHLQRERGDFELALECFDRSESLARQLQDKRALHLALSGRAVAYAESGNYEAAGRCYDQAEKICQTLGNRRGLAVNQANRGLMLTDLGEFEESLKCFESVEAINRSMHNKPSLALGIGNRGYVLLALTRHDEALQCLETALEMHRDLGDKMQVAINRGDRACVLLSLHRTAEARDELQDVLDTLAALDATQTRNAFNFGVALASAETALGNSTEALRRIEECKSLAASTQLTASHGSQRIRESLATLAHLSR